jgi:Mn2+/Fe2+ NRAMP family transporter
MNEPQADSTERPPRTIPGILRRLGPGLIIAGSIVGSGELIATTKTGAQAGFWLLWLIIIGCVIKLFAQVEFGRYTISSGKTTMVALNEVPGPRLRANWLVWYWLAMFIVSLAQLGGIVGGVGQSLAMSRPITGDFQGLLKRQEAWDERAGPICARLPEAEIAQLTSRNTQVRQTAQKRIQQSLAREIGEPRPDWSTWDDVYWATLVTLVTIVLLVIGRYALIQNVATTFVASFTLVTIVAVFALLRTRYAIHWGDVWQGLKFHIPKAEEMTRPVLSLVQEKKLRSPLATALATFGIIGVGATELIAYPYWCLEKGYARFTGPRNDAPQWAERARGWMRVMRWDACISMVIFTFATMAFYMLGAAVLHPQGRDPAGNHMIRALSRPYEEVFGSWAWGLFLFGAFAVLYSTFFVAIAGHTRVASDALRVFGVAARTERSRLAWIKGFCVLLPVVSLVFFVFIRAPAKLVLASGVMQAIMLPMLGGATLYFRYRRCDRRILPGRLWDVMLWLSAFGLLLAGGWLALTKLVPGLERLGM